MNNLNKEINDSNNNNSNSNFHIVFSRSMSEKPANDSIYNSNISNNYDFNQAKRFLSILDKNAVSFCFQTFDDKKILPGSKEKKRKELVRLLNGSFDEFANQLMDLNQRGAGIYVTTNETDGKGRETKNITRVRAVFVDLDGAPLEPVLNAEILPHLVVETSLGRYHVYYLVSDCQLRQFKDIQKSLVEKFDGDSNVIDLPRVVRLPGFYHMKYPESPFLSQIHLERPNDPYTVDQIVSMLGQTGSNGSNGSVGNYRGRNNFIWDGKSDIGEGSRNSTLFYSGCSYRRDLQYNDANIRETLHMMNHDFCKPPLDEDEVDTIIKQVCKYPPGSGGGGGMGQNHHGAVNNNSSIYQESPNGIIYMKPTSNGNVPKELTNFSARITSEIAKDDGVEVKRNFEISANLKEQFFKFNVPANDFSSLNWVMDKMGASAIVYSVPAVKDHVRVAIQTLSGDKIDSHTIYTHLGWRKIDNDWMFLHSGGGISANGMRTDITVEPDGARLKDYELPVPPIDSDLKDAIKAVLDMIHLAPSKIIYPLLSAIFRAPLREVMNIDLSLFFAGPTGCQKSEITGIAQSFFGSRFHGKNLPGNWTTTANSLERQSFLVKDCIFTVDDFAPGGTQSDVSRLHREADRLLRAQGNQSGRGRMRQDSSLRPEYFPRGLIISSGEDLPNGQSLRARMMVVEIKKGDIVLDVLTDVQKKARDGIFAGCMAGYVQYLASIMDSLKISLSDRFLELREKTSQSKFSHNRTSDIVASLMLGMETFLDFAVNKEAMSQPDREQFEKSCWEALSKVGMQQSEHQEGEEPASRFRELLFSAISTGYGYMTGINGKIPQNQSKWGWNKRGFDEWTPNGNKIGWLGENDELYLDPDATYAVVQKLARDQNSSIPTNKNTLWKRLDEKGFIVSKDSGRKTIRKNIENSRRYVLHVVNDNTDDSPTPERNSSVSFLERGYVF